MLIRHIQPHCEALRCPCAAPCMHAACCPPAAMPGQHAAGAPHPPTPARRTLVTSVAAGYEHTHVCSVRTAHLRRWRERTTYTDARAARVACATEARTSREACATEERSWRAACVRPPGVHTDGRTSNATLSHPRMTAPSEARSAVEAHAYVLVPARTGPVSDGWTADQPHSGRQHIAHQGAVSVTAARIALGSWPDARAPGLRIRRATRRGRLRRRPRPKLCARCRARRDCDGGARAAGARATHRWSSDAEHGCRGRQHGRACVQARLELCLARTGLPALHATVWAADALRRQPLSRSSTSHSPSPRSPRADATVQALFRTALAGKASTLRPPALGLLGSALQAHTTRRAPHFWPRGLSWRAPRAARARPG